MICQDSKVLLLFFVTSDLELWSTDSYDSSTSENILVYFGVDVIMASIRLHSTLSGATQVNNYFLWFLHHECLYAFINIFYCLCLVNKNCSRFPPLIMDAQVLHNVSLLTSLPCLSRLNVSASQCTFYIARSNNACQTSDNYTIVCSDANKTCWMRSFISSMLVPMRILNCFTSMV